jgi:coenzyme F420-dependent glucose-6-phosphate dehydrogenase
VALLGAQGEDEVAVLLPELDRPDVLEERPLEVEAGEAVGDVHAAADPSGLLGFPNVPLRIGYKASAEQFGPRELVELAVLAEQHGLDTVVVSDHYQPWRHEGGHAPFSLAWMSAVGERTSRVLLGTSVLTPTFRYHPAVIAQAFATMGSLFPGRVMLGVGTGEAMNEVAVTGIEWPEFKERYARLRESVRLMRALWTEERVTFEGDYYRTEGATVYDRPDQPVPVYIAAGGPQVAKYAGRAGDGFICTSGKGMELYADKLLPAVVEGREAAGKDPDGIDRMIEIKLSYDPDPDRALENTRFWAPLALTGEQKAGLEDPIEMQRAGDALPIEQVASRWIVASDPEETVAAVKPYVDLGFDHLVFHAPGEDQRRFLDAFSEQVVPRLREL